MPLSDEYIDYLQFCPAVSLNVLSTNLVNCRFIPVLPYWLLFPLWYSAILSLVSVEWDLLGLKHILDLVFSVMAPTSPLGCMVKAKFDHRMFKFMALITCIADFRKQNNMLLSCSDNVVNVLEHFGSRHWNYGHLHDKRDKCVFMDVAEVVTESWIVPINLAKRSLTTFIKKKKRMANGKFKMTFLDWSLKGAVSISLVFVLMWLFFICIQSLSGGTFSSPHCSVN